MGKGAPNNAVRLPPVADKVGVKARWLKSVSNK